MAELDRADQATFVSGRHLPGARLERLARKLEHLLKESERFRTVEKRMEETGEKQVSLSDPDVRSMATAARMPRVVGYNVQSVVDANHHLIVAYM